MFKIEARIVPVGDFTKSNYTYLPSNWFVWSKKYKTQRAAFQALAAFKKQDVGHLTSHTTYKGTYQTKWEYRIVHFYPELV